MVHSTIKGPILPVLKDWLKTASSRGSCCVCVCTVCMWRVYCVYMNTKSPSKNKSRPSKVTHALHRKYFKANIHVCVCVVCLHCVWTCTCMWIYYVYTATLCTHSHTKHINTHKHTLLNTLSYLWLQNVMWCWKHCMQLTMTKMTQRMLDFKRYA